MNVSGDTFLGQTVGTLPLRAPVFVPPGTPVAQAARAMHAARATACLVGAPDRLDGILTERDLVRAVAEGRDPALPVETLMSRGVVCVGLTELVAEATLRMVRHAIRRVAVTGADGRCLAILEEHDMLAARTDSPVALAVETGRAPDAKALRRAHDKLAKVAAVWMDEGVSVEGVGSLAAGLRDQLLIRAAQLALAPTDATAGTMVPSGVPSGATLGPDVQDAEGASGRFGGLGPSGPQHDGESPSVNRTPDPGPLALAVLGSEGRREQYLATDQDNCLILGPGADDALATAFAVRMLAILAGAGLPPCPHKVTVDNPEWRMSLADWRDRIEAMAREPGSQAVLALSLMADIRHVYGDETLVQDFRQHLIHCVREHTMALRLMAREACRFAPPLGVFGGLSGSLFGGLVSGFKAGKGGLDIKRGGIFPLTQGARVLALELGLATTATTARLEGACQAGTLGRDTTDSLKQAYGFLQELRLRFQAADMANGRLPGNMVDPAGLSRLERSRLKDCLGAVDAFQALLSNKYRLHLLT